MKPELLPVTYDLAMVVLSWLVSAVGAFTALSAIGRARKPDGTIDRLNVCWPAWRSAAWASGRCTSSA